MYRLTLGLGTFNGKRDELESLQDLRDAGNGLARINVRRIQRYGLPPIYSSGVKYYHERGIEDDWQDALVTYQTGFGDCDDLSCWRVAELWLLGIACSVDAAVRYTRAGKQRYHIFVSYADGRLEDPATLCGMTPEMASGW